MVQVQSVTSMKEYHVNICYGEEGGGYIADIPRELHAAMTASLT